MASKATKKNRQKRKTKAKTQAAIDRYERHKAAVNKAALERSRLAREIGPPPLPVDPKRKAGGERSFRAFCENYFPGRFTLTFSKDHLTAIARIEQTVLEGGLFALAMPRNSGKTTLFECAYHRPQS